MRRLSLGVLLVTGACSTVGGVSDGTSLSYGWSNRGELVNAVELPARGDGYQVPQPWASRGLSWGTEELVGLIVRSARRLRAGDAAATLYVADMSPRRGGASFWHRSHQTGRDADLLFYALDEKGRAAGPTTAMVRFDADGVGAPVDEDGKPVTPRTFDVARNWELVRALLADEAVEVQFLFIYEPLREKLLEYATARGEAADLVARAEAVMLQPGDSLPHDDHLHVRIYCPASDRSLGCYDRGPVRWLKKGWKYEASRPRPALVSLPDAPPLCRLLASSLVAAL
jgi:penicillin-insensitive murein DD-endopeptidase